MLGGITRELVLELLAENHIAYLEQDISETELHAADEVWITASSKDIIPITQLDDHAVGNGKPGAKWEQVIQLYLTYRSNLQAGIADEEIKAK
jgi:D-alanine transaminase